MKLIIPMAGVGKRMRPYTLTTPKPLIHIAGKAIVQRLIEDIVEISDEKITEIAFIIAKYSEEVENKLKKLANNVNAEAKIFYQKEALGTAHAIYCAERMLKGKIIIAFADTLFKSQVKINSNSDGIIWLSKIENPKEFGVVKLDDNGFITDFVEKPENFVSNLAIIGIYYIKEAELLKKEIKFLLDNNIKEKGEYQLTNALENLKNKGVKFKSATVEEWLDCGNKDATIYTNQRILEIKKNEEKLISDNIKVQNSNIIKPCFIANDVIIKNSVVGPYVSIGKKTVITDSIIKNTIIFDNSKLKGLYIKNSMIGNNVEILNKEKEINTGDFNKIYE